MTRPNPRSLAHTLLLGAVGVLALSASLVAASRVAFGPVFVPSDSMWPSVEAGSYVFVNRIAYGTGSAWRNEDLLRWAEPARGDIVVFHAPAATHERPGTYYIKRVVALPGDTVEVRDQRLVVNGKPLVYAREQRADTWTEQAPEGTRTVRLRGKSLANLPARLLGPDCVFVMGDNRGASQDSRAWGCVAPRSIEGKATSLVYKTAG